VRSCTRDPAELDGILDEAVTDPLLAPYSPWLQCRVPINEEGVKRLFRSLEHGVAPVERYGCLAHGRAHEPIAEADLAALIREIGRTPDGVSAALEIAFFRLNREHTEDGIVSVGRELIQRVDFAQMESNSDHKLGSVLLKCLRGDNGAAASRVCANFKSALLGGHPARALQMRKYDKVFSALCRTQPAVVLDTFLGGEEREETALLQMLGWMRGDRQSPFGLISNDIWRTWCEANPTTRYVTAAGHVVYLQEPTGETTPPEWSDIALYLIEHAADPLAILRRFVDRFRPTSMYTGSLASILEGRRPLLQGLLQHPRPDIAAAAARTITELDRTIESKRTREAERSRAQDESFE
jgi:hypothetical protein